MATRAPTATIASRIFTPEGGAAAFRLAALATALEDAGYETTVLTTQVPVRVQSTKKVRRFPVLRNRSGAVRGYLQYASFDLPLFFRLLVAPRATITIVEPPPTTGVAVRLASALRRTPYAYFAADVSSVAAAGIGVNRTVVRILRVVESWALRGARVVLAVSEGVRHEVAALGVSEDRITVVGTGVDTEVFRPDGELPDETRPYLIYAGTMSEIQGASVLIEAFIRISESHPRALLMMFGHGTQESNLRAIAGPLAGERIQFRGTVPGPEVAPWLRGARAALASMSPDCRYEFAHATKAFAGLACGSPVIYAGAGVTADLIRDHDLGWAVPWDIAAVAAAMDAALNSEPIPQRRVSLATWAAENYSLRSVAEKAVHALTRATAPTA
ncbi:MAG: glycosyltransferase [Terrimesophilobacter sp.]